MLAIHLAYTSATKFTDEKCLVTKYRSTDGRCNNVHHPDWGTKNSQFLQLKVEIQGKIIKLLIELRKKKKKSKNKMFAKIN